MEKKELPKYLDDDFLDKLFGFCYVRTRDSHEANELCSDIVYELIKASGTGGEITNPYSFIWRVARNVYADFSDARRRHADMFYGGDPDGVLKTLPDKENDDDGYERLSVIYRRIAFLTRAYREVMIMYYLDGLSAAEIAKRQHTSEGAVRQRLFSAREKIKSEVKEMDKSSSKPLALEKIDFFIVGTGSPGWGDPRDVCHRLFSKHIIWLCSKKAMSAAEIAEELNVPTVYVEEELEILTAGANGRYGVLRRRENGKYAINFILFDAQTIEKAHALYTERLPMICDTIAEYIKKHREEYLSFPYLNKKIDLNLILWQQIYNISNAFSDTVERILAEKHFPQYKAPDRPFTVYGHVDNGKYYGCGWDGVDAENICGFSRVHLDNIYITRIRKHFSCGLNVSLDPQIQLALRSIDGLEISSLSEKDKEYAAKAVECGYLYRDGDTLYTKILVSRLEDSSGLYKISEGLKNGFFEKDALITADKIAALIKKAVPDYLLGEWRFANNLANLPITDAVVEALIEKGVLTPPENGIGAEGCWMQVEK